MKPTGITPTLTAAMVFGLAQTVDAADGTYTSQTGAWNLGGSWSGGPIADGTDSTAFFTNDVTANRSTSLGADRTIDELGLRERTIIIFTTDNGSTGSIFGTMSGRKVKGGKAQKSEAGVCNPFIVNAPGLVPAGVETHALTDFTDLLPTFVDLAGGEIPDDLEVDGISIAPVILGKAKDSSREWIMAPGTAPPDSMNKASADTMISLPA